MIVLILMFCDIDLNVFLYVKVDIFFSGYGNFYYYVYIIK